MRRENLANGMRRIGVEGSNEKRRITRRPGGEKSLPVDCHWSCFFDSVTGGCVRVLKRGTLCSFSFFFLSQSYPLRVETTPPFREAGATKRITILEFKYSPPALEMHCRLFVPPLRLSTVRVDCFGVGQLVNSIIRVIFYELIKSVATNWIIVIRDPLILVKNGILYQKRKIEILYYFPIKTPEEIILNEAFQTLIHPLRSTNIQTDKKLVNVLAIV